MADDPTDLDDVVRKVIRDNPASAEAYRHGSPQALGYLVGRVMQATDGEADVAAVQKAIREHLDREAEPF